MMTTDTSTLVSLQAPKDVSIDEIESSLGNIWQAYSGSEEGMAATRATTFSFIVYEPEVTQQLLAALGFYSGPIDGIAGPRTTMAIKAAQQAYSLPPTGKSDEIFLSRLQSEFEQAKKEGKITSKSEKTAQPYPPDLGGAAIADAIAASNPCRIITLCPTAGEDEGVTAQVSAYCPIQKRNHHTLVCCEYITLRGTAIALERISGIISALMIPELPKFLWWKATPEPDYGLFKRLATQCDNIIIDSSTFREPESDLKEVAQMIQQGTAFVDLNWARLAAWQELTAETFDPPERRAAVWEVDRLTIDYEQGNPAQAIMFLGWVASRLQWQPVAYTHEPGDYDIRRFTLTTSKHREIQVELAGIPLSDWGNVLGDLISIKLSSTNPDADCCTVLCSETTGCMRMEAGGGAQSCQIQQVTSLADQNTEDLMRKQLQRSVKDLLYVEAMDLVHQILR